jgi:hypothetical protein
MVEYKEALREIDQKDFRDNKGSFAIQFMTCDINRNTGGEIITIENACKCGLPPNCKSQEMRGIKDMDTGKQTAVHNALIFQINHKPIFWI